MGTRVVAVEPAHVEALLEGDAVFTARFGMPVAAGYLDFPEALPVLADALAAGMPPEWYSHLIVDDADTVVGFGGFKGPPVNGVVEIGYSVAPAHRQRGHATAAVDQWVALARERGVAIVCAHTLPEPNASNRLLARSGFEMTGVMVDAEIGDVWRWELRLD